MKKVMIVGGNFNNKGAESMLFVAVDEVKKRLPGAEVWYAGTEDLSKAGMNFPDVYYDEIAKDIAMGGFGGFIASLKGLAKDSIKLVIGRRTNLWRHSELKKLLPQLDLIIDISGFALGDKWDEPYQLAYLKNIRLAQKYGVQMYLMPQSFGPFDYAPSMAYLKDEIAKLLKVPRLIFAREREGFELLGDMGLTNVILSTDLVLQNKSVDMRNIFCRVPEISTPEIPKHSIGIVPNSQCFRSGEEQAFLNLYCSIIEKLIAAGRKVYIFRHSHEDGKYCRMIAEAFGDHENLVLLKQDFSCFEYDDFVKKFDFIVCSRYHGIVHAYRNAVPCLVLGWAVKYQELCGHLKQNSYAFDISAPYSDEDILAGLDALLENYAKEQDVIQDCLNDIQKDDCFRCLSEEV